VQRLVYRRHIPCCLHAVCAQVHENTVPPADDKARESYKSASDYVENHEPALQARAGGRGGGGGGGRLELSWVVGRRVC
jgi:hypothetical protein